MRREETVTELICINATFGSLNSLIDMFMLRSLVLAFLILVPTADVSFAQYGKDGDIVKGRAMASRLCARCHSIDKQGSSPLPAAPPFRELSSKWPLSHLEEALAEGIVTGHSDMPEYEMMPAEIIDLLSFIDTISDK